MNSDLIIRVTYEGDVYDLDVINEVPLRVDMSAVEVGELGRVFGIGSQQFTLPGTKKNNKFFKNAYDIAADNPPGMYNSIDGFVIQNGETLLQGQFQLMEVVTDEDGFVNYNVQISDRIVQFKEAIQGKYIADGNWSSYTHTLTSSSIVDSWSGNLLSGSIFYPLAEYGRPDNEQGSFPYPYLGFFQGNLMGTQLRPIQVEQFLPAVKVKDALTVMFNQVGFSYTGSFTEKPEIDNLYMLTKANDSFGPVVPSASATFTAQGSSTNKLVFLGSVNEQVPVTVETFDPLNAYNTTTSEYTALASGDHTFNGSITFFNPVTGGDSARIKLDLAAGTYPSSTTIISSVEQDFTGGTGAGPFTLSVAGTQSLTTGTDDVWLQISYTALSGTPITLVILGDTGRQFRCTQAPTTFKGATIDMSDQFNPELKSEDIITALVTQFNLVLTPFDNNPSIIQIETFDDWIRQGAFVDWNDKYDTSQRTSITHTINELPKKVTLTQAEDNDRLSKVTKEQEPYRQYGSLELFAESNNAIGDDTLETVFAPIILGGVYDASALGSSSFDIDISSTVIYPHLYKYENDKITPYGFKPRLGFKVNNNLPSGSLIFIGDPSGGGPYTGDTISGSYGTISNLSQLPGVAGSTIDLHFNNTYQDFGSNALNLDNANDAFNTYWKTYYDSLYWDDAKKITLSAKFDPYEYKNIKLNDKILIKNQYYRINKIKGFNVSYRDVVEVELIRLYPAYFQFVIAPGPSPTPTPSPSPTPSPTPVTPTPTPTPSPVTPTPTPTPSPVTPTPTPSPSPVTPTPTPSPTPSPVTPTPTPSPTPSPVTPTPTPSPTPAIEYYEFENCDTEEIVYQESVAPGITINDRYSNGVTNFVYTGNTTTLPGTIVVDLTFIGGTGCFDPTPTPTPIPQTLKAEIQLCGGGAVYYVEFTAFSSLPNGFVIKGNGGTLGTDCWEIIDNEYGGAIEFTSSADEEFSSCAGCLPTPTPTPTPTATPTPTPVVFSYSVAYSAVSEFDACSIGIANDTVFTTCSSLADGCILYQEVGLINFAPDGWYYEISTGDWYNVEGSGFVEESGVCSTPTPTPTPSPSPPPCTLFDIQATGSASDTLACLNGTFTAKRRHDGAGAAPEIGDFIYTGLTCITTFNGGNLWYFVNEDTSAIEINSGGLVTGKTFC